MPMRQGQRAHFSGRGSAFATTIATTVLIIAPAAVAQQQPQQRPPQTPAPQTQPAQRPQTQPARPPQQQQQQQRPAQPKQPEPQPPQQAQQAPAGQPPLIYSQWTKLCPKDANGKQLCVTSKDARLETGMLIASAALIEPEGQPKKLLRVNVPLAMQLQHGTRVVIDQTAPRTAGYFACFVTGCISDYEANVDTINQLKKSQQLHIQAIGINGQPFAVPLPLADFAKAYDGPPTDPKVFEEQQKKLQEEFQRKQQELQQQGPWGPHPGRQQQ
jgi:invasion protein IalB